MNIYNIKKSSLSETDGISLNIYLSGCHGHCEGCHSDHTWDFNGGSKLNNNDLVAFIKEQKDFTFDNICILGGEPLDQPLDELAILLQRLKEEFPSKPLWLYTSFRFMQVPSEIKESIDYLKTGKYLMKRPAAKEQYGVFLASNNQVIHKLGDN